MKKFIVIESNNKNFIGEIFKSNTQITKMVNLPFTNEEYRCTMFNGVNLKLVNKDNEIIAIIKK